MKVGQNFFAEKEEKLSQDAIHDICHQHASSACEEKFQLCGEISHQVQKLLFLWENWVPFVCGKIVHLM